jgi:hypothetical protein
MSVENQQFTEVFNPYCGFDFLQNFCRIRGNNVDLKTVKAHIGLSEKSTKISNYIVELKSKLFQVYQTPNQLFSFPQ